MINDPIVLLVDASPDALDSKSRKEIMDLLGDVDVAKGVAIVFVSHDPDMAM